MCVRSLQFIRPLVAAAMIAASTLYAVAQAPPTPTRVRGTIEGVDGDTLAVKSRGGEDVKLHMTGDIKVLGITKISLADIKVGSFVGTTTGRGPTVSITRLKCMSFRKICAAPARARVPTIRAPTAA